MHKRITVWQTYDGKLHYTSEKAQNHAEGLAKDCLVAGLNTRETEQGIKYGTIKLVDLN